MVNNCDLGTSDTDDAIDEQISYCLNPDHPVSFFLYAGAGSGKTYSLVNGLEKFELKYGKRFRTSGVKIGVITYTNAACDEIIERLKSNSTFHVCTIHSFCWSLIKIFHDDIRFWLKNKIPEEINELQHQEEKGKSGTAASMARQTSITNNRNRLEWLKTRREFTYSPNGDNFGKESLSHSEVIESFSYFLATKPSFQRIVVNKYPFILIDESQDTNKHLIESLFILEAEHRGRFSLGLIGDMMQQIYGDGMRHLGADLPSWWMTLIKQMNRRSPKRIVALANDIRADADRKSQKVLVGKPDGYIRLFTAPAYMKDKPAFEQLVRLRMAELATDPLWSDSNQVKHLMLEHRMAAMRMGFDEMFTALSSAKRLATGLKSGDLPAVSFFTNAVLPLYELQKQGSDHATMAHLRKAKCPLLSIDFLRNQALASNPLGPLKIGVDNLVNLLESNPDVSFLAVLQCVAQHNLFLVPKSLTPFAGNFTSDETNPDIGEPANKDKKDESSSVEAINQFLATPFKQIKSYHTYVSGQGAFDTHQGVKGREFERVLGPFCKALAD